MQDTMLKAIEVKTKSVDGQVLVHDERNRNIHVLNQTAAEILKLCDGRHSLDEIVDALATDPAVTREQVYRDVTALIEQFRGLGLLEEHA